MHALLIEAHINLAASSRGGKLKQFFPIFTDYENYSNIKGKTIIVVFKGSRRAKL